jgi:glycosyltransferase involved in cell wall biosynthesis
MWLRPSLITGQAIREPSLRLNMRLFLNCLAASAGGGLTYVRNIIPHLSARSDLQATVAIPQRLREKVHAGPNIAFVEIDVPANTARRFYLEQTWLPRRIRESRADALISTGNFALRRSPVPQILLSGNSLYTSPDFYRDLRQRGEYRMWLDTRVRGYLARRSIHWADRTVAPSRSFAKQLQEWTGCNVLSIYHGFDPEFFFADQTPLPPGVQQELDSTTGALRLLFVSHYNYYRNFETLLRAMPILIRCLGRGEVKLLLTCKLRREDNPGSYDASTANALVQRLDISEDVIQLGAIPYHHLHKIYRSCDIYVTPAYTETFAFPLVEAMASGLPIVASDLPVHREISAGAAQFFNAFSPEELADRVVELAQSAEPRERQIEAGLKRAAAFSWAKHVDALADLASGLAPQTR